MAVEEFDELNDFGDGERASVRKQAAPSAPKSRSRRAPNPRRIKVVAYAAGMVAGLALFAYVAARFLIENDRFKVATVEVVGATFIDPEEVQSIFAPDMKRSVLKVPLDKRIVEVQALPWVRSASVRRVLPNRLRVTVVERVPVAFVGGEDGIGLIDAAGAFLELPDGATFQFPVVRGVNESDSLPDRKRKMEVFAAVMKDLDRGGLPRESISEVNLDDPEDARLVLSDSVGSTLLHLGGDNYYSRYQTYLTNVNDWRGKFPHLHSVDLRYKGQVVVNADPSPTAQIKARLAEAGEKEAAAKQAETKRDALTQASVRQLMARQVVPAPRPHRVVPGSKKLIASTESIASKSSKKPQRR